MSSTAERGSDNMAMWYEKTGKNQDVVLSTKVVITRNVRGYNFPCKMNGDECRQLLDQVDQVIDKNKLGNTWSGTRLPVPGKEDNNVITPESQLFGRRLNVLKDADRKAIYYSDDAGLSVTVNQDEHLTIRAMRAGHDPAVYNMADSLAASLERKLDIAYSERHGFLTSDIKLAGTGTVILYTVAIPAIVKSNGGLNMLRQRVNQYYWTIYPFDEQGQYASSNVYIISNISTRGVSGEEVLRRGEMLISDIIQLERGCREQFATRRNNEVSDLYGRSYGLLRYAKSVGPREALDALGWMRLYKEYDDAPEFEISWEKLNKLTQDICWEAERFSSKAKAGELNKIRANKIKTILKGDE